MSNASSADLELVGSSVWRSALLAKFAALPDFDSLLAQSCSPAGVDKTAGSLAELNMKAAQIVRSHDRQELVVARQYYNNEHLVRFWRFFCEELDKIVASNDLDPDFPLFEITMDLSVPDYRVGPLAPSFLEGHAGAGDGGHESRGSCSQISSRFPDVDHGDLRRLFVKLSVFFAYQASLLAAFYRLFLNIHRKQGGEIWDYYRIHFFLDNHLYGRDNEYFYRSSFDLIFFNSNLLELGIFLHYHFSRGLPLSLDDVRGFLRRQTEYHLKRALTISMEDNEIFNRRKDLLEYLPDEGLVSMRGVSDELRAFYRKSVIEYYGLLKQGGCPFAKSKGVSRNALLELYGYSNELIIQLLSRAEEFDRVFRGTAAAAPSDHGNRKES